MIRIFKGLLFNRIYPDSYVVRRGVRDSVNIVVVLTSKGKVHLGS